MDLYEGSESSSDYDEPDEEQKLLRHEVRVNGQRHATPQQFAHSHSGAAFSGDTHETDPNDKLGRCWCKCRSHDKHKHRDSAGSGHRCERGVCHSRCCGCFCRNTWKQNLCSVAVGSLVGVAVFWGTTCALYAISVNAVASIVCGCTLLAISCVVAVRAANPFNDFSDTAKLFTLAFSIVLFLAAIFCLLLDKKVQSYADCRRRRPLVGSHSFIHSFMRCRLSFIDASDSALLWISLPHDHAAACATFAKRTPHR